MRPMFKVGSNPLRWQPQKESDFIMIHFYETGQKPMGDDIVGVCIADEALIKEERDQSI